MRVFLRVGQLVGQPILARLARGQLLLGLALGVGVEFPGLHGRFDRLAFLVGNLQERQLAAALDRLAVEPAGGQAGVDRIADAVIAAIDPGVDRERLAGDQHAARADDRPPRGVDHFGRDRVAVVLVAVDRLGDGRVDFDLHRAVGADLHFPLGRPVPAAIAARGHQNGIGRMHPQRFQPGYQS